LDINEKETNIEYIDDEEVVFLPPSLPEAIQGKYISGNICSYMACMTIRNYLLFITAMHVCLVCLSSCCF
jgi:hypothetical protein